MKILICGEGGSGKSTISALLAEELASKGHKVLVVDTDESNFGLYKHLGMEQPKDFMESLGGKAGLRDKLMAFIRSEGSEMPNMMPEQFCIDEIPPEVIVGKNGIKLVHVVNPFFATFVKKRIMKLKYVYWQDGIWWLGYLDEYPDYQTQGSTHEELLENLKDIYLEMTSGKIRLI